jgi:hypothetical protein
LTAPLDPAALFRRLHEAGVRYVVVGGFAVIAHGVQRATADLDICPDPDPTNLGRLAGLLTDLGGLDVMQWIPGIGDDLAYPELSEAAITAQVRGAPVSVCSRAHLIAMKRAADRPLDQADLDQLEKQRDA